MVQSLGSTLAVELENGLFVFKATKEVGGMGVCLGKIVGEKLALKCLRTNGGAKDTKTIDFLMHLGVVSGVAADSSVEVVANSRVGSDVLSKNGGA